MSTEVAESRQFIYGHHYKVDRGLYSHHGIFIGEGNFIHYATHQDDGIELVELLGVDSDLKKIHVAEVRKFVGDGHLEEVHYENDNVYPPLKVVARALGKEGEDGYNLWSNNCEHFARWCKIAKTESLQVNIFRDAAKGAVAGALLGRWFGLKGALIGSGAGLLAGVFRSWFPPKPFVPVYREFIEYASLLFAATKRKHPLGKSFRHGREDQGAQSLKIPEGKKDSILVFYYSGSWLFSEKNDWFITERAIVFPHREVYVNFHDVQKIYSSRGKLTIDTIDGQTIRFPSKFLHAKSAAKFLDASVSCTPLYESDFRISPRSILKEMLQMLIGGIVLTIGVGYFFPDTVPWLSGISLLVVLVSPFMDENDNTSWREWSPSRQWHDRDVA